jgi:hypothetical protein
VLERDAEGHWLVPIKVDEVDDEHAEAMVLSENLDRTDLSAWEWALAWRQRRDSLRRRGAPATVRDVAESVGKKFQTIGEYLRAADALTPAVLAGAGAVRGGEPDHRRMGRLSLAALLRVARDADTGPEAGSERLLHELKRAGDSAAAQALIERRKARRQEGGAGGRGFQINIRQSLSELSPRQAAHYLSRMAPALAVLAERAADEVDAAPARELADALERAAARLRSRH